MSDQIENKINHNQNKNQKVKMIAIIGWLFAALFFFAEYFARVAPSVMAPHLMSAFNVTALSLGALSAYFYYAYIGMQIPVGALVDRYGPHKLLSVMAIGCGIAAFSFGATHSIHLASIARLFMGF